MKGKKTFCCYCGRWIIPPLKHTQEHLIPLSKGGNIFPFRATDPKELITRSFEEIAPFENFRHTKEMKTKCALTVLAYGNPVIKDAAPEWFDKEWMALKVTKLGNPCHPLYLKSDLKPVPLYLLRGTTQA